MIGDTIRTIRLTIDTAAGISGRRGEEVQLVAVTKTVPVALIVEAVRHGITMIGESRIQEASSKKEAIPQPVSWHLVGHLQTNKAKKAVQLFDMIQSLDSVRLGEEINRCAGITGKVQECLVEVKVSLQETRFGLPPEELKPFLDAAVKWPHIRIKGIMTIAPFYDNPELTRSHFRDARELFENIKKESMPHYEMSTLSMGMSNDYQVAVEEGSTMVRIGTAIFGERGYEKE